MKEMFGKAILPACLLVVAGMVLILAGRQADEPSPQWLECVKEIQYESFADSSLQPGMFYSPQVNKPAPLLVALHTWSGNYRQKSSIPYVKWCIEKDWVFIHPHFRGPNRRPEATGSELVVGDIISAVEYAKENASVDTDRIYLVGASGGGYTALLLAGRAPRIWAGVSAWASISNLKNWYFQCRQSGRKYADEIARSCGGLPGESEQVDLEYYKRSPVAYLDRARGVALDINAGILDGHEGSVPVNHSLRAFNCVAREKEHISEEDIEYIVRKARVPRELRGDYEDTDYGGKKVLFRRRSGNARVTVFDGGHEIIYEAALKWLEKQRKNAQK